VLSRRGILAASRLLQSTSPRARHAAERRRGCVIGGTSLFGGAVRVSALLGARHRSISNGWIYWLSSSVKFM